MASKILGVCFLAVVAAGCRGNSDAISSIPGHYEGFLVSGAPQSQVHSSVSAEIADNQGKLEVRVLSPLKSSAEIDFEVQFLSQSEVQISSSTGYLPQAIQLKQTQDGCFSDSKNRLCVAGREVELTLEALNSRFVLDQMLPGAVPAMEAPATYTIDQLVDRAKNQNFDNQVSFQGVIQARLTARNAAGNLLPHVNFTTALSVVQGLDPKFSLLTLLRTVGDLVPFFLPNRWYQAAASRDTSNADFDAYRVVQADSMNVIQGIALSVIRDEQTLDRLEQNLVSIVQIRDQILIIEKNGSLQFGSSNEVSLVINHVESTIESLKEAIKEELTSLSQGSGFMNPDAVQNVAPINVATLTGPISGSVAEWQGLAITQSLELQQIRDMVKAAQNTKDARQFQWLDPSGDDAGSLGLGLIDYVAIGNSNLDALYKKREATQSMLLKSVQDVLTESQEIYAQYQLAVQSSQLDQQTIDRLLMDLQTGINFSLSDLVSALQDKAQSDVAQVSAQYAFLALQAQINFLTFSDIYSPLLTER